MRRRNIELWLSLVAVIGITFIYGFVVLYTGSIPKASAFFGHSLGVLGFLMMLMTEVLYSIRKRSRRARWGKMSRWLEFHIFTGLVGPYLVLLHTAWRFQGLAGVLMLLTVIIVISGFIGRYIYTAVPRTADGLEVERAQLEEMVTAADSRLQQWGVAAPVVAGGAGNPGMGGAQSTSNGLWLVFGRSFIEVGETVRWFLRRQGMNATARNQAQSLEKLQRQQRTLQRQLASLAISRQVLSVWHIIHLPIGMALFTVSIFHIFAAIYYATLVH